MTALDPPAALAGELQRSASLARAKELIGGLAAPVTIA